MTLEAISSGGVVMPDLLIPIGAHLFTPEALQSVVAKALATVPADHKSAIVGTVDANGASVVLALSSADGHWKAQTAFQHDWQGSNTFGASGSYSW